MQPERTTSAASAVRPAPPLCTAELISVSDLGSGYRLLRLHAPEIARAAAPGQFVHLRVPALEAGALRRPFGICDADPATGGVSLLYKRVGRGTAAMAALAPGDAVDLMGPLGRGFPAPPPDAAVLLVAGGYGVAPLHFLARSLCDRARKFEGSKVRRFEGSDSGFPEIRLFAGGRTASDLLLLDAFRALGVSVHPATDDGSLGAKGLVTEPLEDFLLHRSTGPLVGRSDRETERPEDRETVLFACGPAPMLRAVDGIAAARGVPAWLSLDRRMACGVGACCGCAQKVRDPDGSVRVAMVCSDGPVFPAGSIVWD